MADDQAPKGMAHRNERRQYDDSIETIAEVLDVDHGLTDLIRRIQYGAASSELGGSLDLHKGLQAALDMRGRTKLAEPVTLIDQAEALKERHALDPSGVLADAASLVKRTRRDPEARVVARHAAALAHAERLDLRSAYREARLALAAASRVGLDRRAAEIRVTLAWLELERGRTAASLVHLDAAQPLLRGRSAARARCMRGLNLCTNGQLTAAITELTAALPGLRRHGDTRWIANALMGRGIAYTYTDQLRAADADFVKAAELWLELGQRDRAGGATSNRAFVAARAGDVPRALELFDQSLNSGLDLRTRPEGLIDRAEAMLAVGLFDDARPVLEAAVRALARAGRAKLAEATQVLAYCAMRQGDLARAQTWADDARRLFRAQGRSWWTSLVAALQVRIRWLNGERSAGLQRAAERAAVECARHGWHMESSASLIVAALVALARGSIGQARSLLGGAAALRSRGTADVRAAAWYAEALLRQAAGDQRGALSACRAGLRVVDDHGALLGSPELQAHATQMGRDLAGLAIGVTLENGDARAILRWTERYRAGALARPAVRPPADSQLAASLITLRSAVAAAREAAEAGRPDPVAERRVARLEQAVRRRVLTASSSSASGRRRDSLDLSSVHAALGPTALLSLIVHSGRLRAVTMVDGRTALHDLGPAEPVYAELDALRFGLHRLARGASTPQVEQVIHSAVNAAAATLDKMLLGPVLAVIDDRPLVVVPTGPLHAMPWAALHTCAGRPITVAPSVLSWLRTEQARPQHPGAGSIWIAGPRLRHGEAEVVRLHQDHGGRLLTGSAATVDAVLAAIDSVDIAHVLAHGRFRKDQPLFSTLELADGPLYVHDLERLRRGPRVLVLTASEAGLSAVEPGDELMGLAAALLSRGTTSLIASVVPVPDDDRTAAVMVALHNGLRAGRSPSDALAAAQADHFHLGFVCFGAQ